MWLIYLWIVSFIFCGALVIGEIIATKLPNTKFTNWWRKNVIADMD
jgi:hypothetical protein